MTLVATVIAAPTGLALDDTMIAALARQVDARVDWLDPGRAVDLVVQDTAHRRKRLLVTDMDSTVITVECIDVLATQTGIRDEVATITACTIRGELEFAQSLRERVALLAGTPVEALEAAWRQDPAGNHAQPRRYRSLDIRRLHVVYQACRRSRRV